jgi:hypothetical protein
VTPVLASWWKPDRLNNDRLATGNGLRTGELIAGLLYVGGDSSLFPLPAIYLDHAHVNELRRRAAIVRT